MSVTNIVRAWKDEEFLADLSEVERAALPSNPAGAVMRDAIPPEEFGGITIVCTKLECSNYISCQRHCW